MKIEPRTATRYDLSGTIDLSTAMEARSLVEKLIDEQSEEVVIGLGALTEGSSVMVALMMGWVRYARRCERKIVFADVPPKVAQLLEFTGLDSVLPIAGRST